MTKLTDVLRRLAEAEQDQAGHRAATMLAAPAVEPARVAPASVFARPEHFEEVTVDTGSVGIRPVRPDVERLREFVLRDARRNHLRDGSVLLVVGPPSGQQDARAAASGLIGELAGALADPPAGDALVLDMPPAGPALQRSDDVDPAVDVATIADMIRSRPRLTEIARPDESSRIWRATDGRLPLRSPPAPWPALAALLGECRQHFVWTLVDGGPWDAAELAELARRCDSVYLVLHEGRTGRTAARETLGSLRRAGASVSCCLWIARAPDGLLDA